MLVLTFFDPGSVWTDFPGAVHFKLIEDFHFNSKINVVNIEPFDSILIYIVSRKYQFILNQFGLRLIKKIKSQLILLEIHQDIVFTPRNQPNHFPGQETIKEHTH